MATVSLPHIEFKHQNISAVLKGLGEAWILGNKPADNFQMALVDAVQRWILSAVFRHGRLDRGDAALVLKVSAVTARKTLNDLVRLGFLVSDSPKTKVRVAFPLDYRERLFPNLFTDAPLD